MRALILPLVGSALVTLAFSITLAFYLDFRRSNLVGLGLMPKSTPEIFQGSGLNVGLSFSYVFGDLIRSPDEPTRKWAPVLRAGLVMGFVLFGLAIAASQFT